MYKWFADDTGLHTLKEQSAPNVFIFGGVILDRDNEKKLCDLIRGVKSDYTSQDMPIKWNFKDLKKTYSEFGKDTEYNDLLNKSYDWRKEIFEKSLELDYTIIVSIIENFQIGKRGQKEIARDLTRFCFSNALMRVGLFGEKIPKEEKKVILDWPKHHEAKPFNREYYYAFHRGCDSSGNEYKCGPLKKIGFYDSVLFTTMNHSVCLQFADLIIGSIKDYIDTELDGRESSIGKELTEIVKCKIRGYPNKMINRGIIVQNREMEFYQKIRDMFQI